MKISALLVGVCASLAICTPVELPTAVEGELIAAETSSTNCTQYCSPDSGCVCVDWPKDCSAFYTVQPGDTCTSIAEAFGNFTVTQLYKWNKNVGQTCMKLQAYVPACINTPTYTFKPPVQPPYDTHYKPYQTPVPIMPNITHKCTSYELVRPGQLVIQLARQNGFKKSDFARWNGNASKAWAGYWACVSVS